MHDDNQILISDSFVALCTDARGRLRTPVQQLRERIEQINRAVAEMDLVTQQNAALVEQTSAASSSLQQQAQDLAALAGTFQLPQQQGLRAATAPALPR